MSKEYEEFLKSKTTTDIPTGIDTDGIELNPMLFPFQRDIVLWALKRGRAALFEGTGLGKTLQLLEWSRVIHEKTEGNVLILTPLAVARQTVREGEKFGIEVNYCRSQEAVKAGITVTNYEMLDHFNEHEFIAIVVDESSIIKNFSGKLRNQIIEKFAKTQFKLSCTATPAPNDYMELGNQSEFIGVMTRTEMLCTFFIHDGGETSKWKLKGHAHDPFWKWLASWSIMIQKPSDIGYEDGDFNLPPLNIHRHILEEKKGNNHGFLFKMPAANLTDQRRVKRDTIDLRCANAAQLANGDKDQWLVWCELNDEGDNLSDLIPDSKQVAGADSIENKEERLIGFADGKIRALITKPSIGGYGLNLQNCHKMAFVNVTHSYEDQFQAIRRCWRYGQKHLVEVHLFLSESEVLILDNIQRKHDESEAMQKEMIVHMEESMKSNLTGAVRTHDEYVRNDKEGEGWRIACGDCVEEVKKVKSDSIHYTIFSPPFSSLYTYSATERDMGNCMNDKTFYDHFEHLIPELLRITVPGRLLSFHCMNLPLSKERDGVIGIKDFRGNLIRLFSKHGWIFHSEVCIWKDPVTAMQRTKAIGLLYRQLKKDSCISRQGIPDYLVTMRKPGVNPEPVTKKGDRDKVNEDDFTIDMWQRYASPVWMDIKPSNTLQKVREEKDERHICPLQLDVIERGIRLWTNKNDVVFSPFTGIGSEGYVALKMGRRFSGIELKEIYFNQACKNMNRAILEGKQGTLFENIIEETESCPTI